MRTAERIFSMSGAISRAAGILLALMTVLPTAAEADAPVAIVGGTLIDVRTGRQTAGSVILIEGDRISRIGTLNAIDIPPDARVIDAAGKWVMPGLMDMHVHVSGEARLPIALFLALGVTGIRDAGGNITDLWLIRADIAGGKLVGPRLFYCGVILDGIPPLRRNYFLVDTPERARSAVNFLADQDASCVKIYNSVGREIIPAVIAAAGERGLPVTGHVPRSVTVKEVIGMGVQGLEHIRITGRELLDRESAEKIDFLPLVLRETALWEKFDLNSNGIAEIISAMAASRVIFDPTISVDHNIFVADRKVQEADSNNQYLPKALREDWMKRPLPANYIVPPELKAAAASGAAKRISFVGMAARAGVRIIAGTDGVDLGTMLPGFGLHNELSLLREAGLSNLQVLQAATVNAAEAIGEGERLGRIEEGYLADIIITSGDPLKDIGNARKIDVVIANGVVHEPSRLLQSLIGK